MISPPGNHFPDVSDFPMRNPRRRKLDGHNPRQRPADNDRASVRFVGGEKHLTCKGMRRENKEHKERFRRPRTHLISAPERRKPQRHTAPDDIKRHQMPPGPGAAPGKRLPSPPWRKIRIVAAEKRL